MISSHTRSCVSTRWKSSPTYMSDLIFQAWKNSVTSFTEHTRIRSSLAKCPLRARSNCEGSREQVKENPARGKCTVVGRRGPGWMARGRCVVLHAAQTTHSCATLCLPFSHICSSGQGRKALLNLSGVWGLINAC